MSVLYGRCACDSVDHEAIFSPAIAVQLMEFFGSIRPLPAPQIFPELSERELEILA